MVNGSGGVRLVKCPKCFNLLPEFPNVPVYKCGGCGVTLRAKIRAASGETASSVSTQNHSIDISEKGLTISDSKNSLLNEDSERIIENSNVNSSEMEEKNTEKISTGELVSESPNTENLNLKDTTEMESPVELQNVPKEEIVQLQAIKNKENLGFNEVSEKHKFHVRKDTDSSVSDEFHSALNFMGMKNTPKKAPIHRKPPRNLNSSKTTKTNSYEVLQADILSRVDKLRHELVDLFGNPPEEIEKYSHLLRTESYKYRRARISPKENINKAKQNHNLNFHKIEAFQKDKRPQIVSKNLCRPILVGAPFVICSDCFKLIQIPFNFNVETKKLRKLQCGNCNKILLYSYRPHPYGTTPLTSADSETAQTGPYNDPFRRSNPLPISEESFNISYSSELDQHEPLHVSRNSSFSTNEGFNCKRVVGSRLHQIMGYESASEILMKQVSSSSSIARNLDVYERERKGKGVLVNEYSDVEKDMNTTKKIYGQDSSPRRSRIHGLFKKGVSKLVS